MAYYNVNYIGRIAPDWLILIQAYGWGNLSKSLYLDI